MEITRLFAFVATRTIGGATGSQDANGRHRMAELGPKAAS